MRNLHVYFCGTVSWFCTNKTNIDVLFFDLMYGGSVRLSRLYSHYPSKYTIFSSSLNIFKMKFTLVEQIVHVYMLILCVTVLLLQSLVESRGQSVRLRVFRSESVFFVHYRIRPEINICTSCTICNVIQILFCNDNDNGGSIFTLIECVKRSCVDPRRIDRAFVLE